MPYASVDQRRAYQRAYYRAYRAEMRRRYREAGLCYLCGRFPVVRLTRCLRCRSREFDAKAQREAA